MIDYGVDRVKAAERARERADDYATYSGLARDSRQVLDYERMELYKLIQPPQYFGRY